MPTNGKCLKFQTVLLYTPSF